MKFIRIGLLACVFVFFLHSVHAVTLEITQYPSTFDEKQEIEVGVLMGCSNCGNSYLRGVFYPDGTNYFGMTKNNAGDWIGTTSDKTQYFKLTKDDLVGSSWSGILKMKLDVTDANYSGPGQYALKIGRYTSADSSALWSN